MSGIARLAACLATAGLAAASVTSADATTLRRSLPCAAIHLVLTTPLGGTTNSSSVVMKNSGSSAIPAGTVYTYTIPAGTFEHRNPSALGVGQTLSILDARVTGSGSCSASVTGVVINRKDAVPLQNLTLAPG